MRRISFLVLGLLVLGCGGTAANGSAPAGSTASGSGAAPCGGECGAACQMHGQPGHGHGKGHGHGHHAHGPGQGHGHHANTSPELAALHAVLSPVWHSEPGAVRAAKACEAAADLAAKSAPVGDAELSAHAAALVDECKLEGTKNPEAKLTTLHDRFHALIER